MSELSEPVGELARRNALEDVAARLNQVADTLEFLAAWQDSKDWPSPTLRLLANNVEGCIDVLDGMSAPPHLGQPS